MSSYQYRKKTIIDTFNRAATTYDSAAVLPREVAQRLLDHLEPIHVEPKTILDLGCGTGYSIKLLKNRFPRANLIALDLAEKMLTQTTKEIPICADIEKLPFQAHSIDLLFSNLALSWCHLGNAFAEIQRVLQPKGLFLFSMFGPDTLQEVRQSWANVDANLHVHLFFDMHDIGDALLRANFLDPVMEMEYLTLTFGDSLQFFQEIKDLGFQNIISDRKKTLLGKKTWQQFVTELEHFRRKDGLLPATYEIIYGHARGSENIAKIKDNEVTISVHDIKVHSSK